MNLFATVLTNVAPSANYRGASELNRAVMQRVTQGRFEYAVISPEALRNALRETLRQYGLPSNRERLHNEDQLAVRFSGYPDPEQYIDDFFFGYMVAKRADVPAKLVKERNFQFKRDSILRMNLAVAIEPYRHDALFTQSPLTVKNPDAPWQNATESALLHRETSVTAFQYPFAMNLDDCRLDSEQHQDWLRHLLRGISELNGAAGNHARSYFEMAPASILIRQTDRLAAGYDLYGFRPGGGLPEVIEGILAGDYPGSEFTLGGALVRNVLDDATREALRERGASLHRTADQALDATAAVLTGRGFTSPATQN
ncbi:MAG: type I-B CRISPR-associated protein Cas7/Cst2/DevR [Dehalococcoidia bacterium]